MTLWQSSNLLLWFSVCGFPENSWWAYCLALHSLLGGSFKAPTSSVRLLFILVFNSCRIECPGLCSYDKCEHPEFGKEEAVEYGCSPKGRLKGICKDRDSQNIRGPTLQVQIKVLLLLEITYPLTPYVYFWKIYKVLFFKKVQKK